MNRSTWLFTAASAGVLVCAALAQAGIYSSLEPRWTLSRDHFRKFQEDSLTPLKQLASPEAKTEWQKYYHLAAKGLLLVKDPLPASKPNIQSQQERLDLAVCLLRVREPGKGMPEKAKILLNELLKNDRENFLAMSTLANACFMLGEYQKAEDNFDDAWRYWGKAFKDQKEAWQIVNEPEAWEAACAKSFGELKPERKQYIEKVLQWSVKDFAWYAKCEMYQRRLARLRRDEARIVEQPKSKSGRLALKGMNRLDPLFDPVPPPKNYQPLRFVGESGKFEPDKIASAEKTKLPADAVEIVQQLLIWTPDDLRLFWLLGELVNAQGDGENAEKVYKEFLGKFSQFPEFDYLRERDPKTGELKPLDPKIVQSEFVERHPEVGHRLTSLIDYNKQAQVPDVPPRDDAKKNDTPPGGVSPDDETKVVGASLNLDWRTLIVGLGVGAIVGFFISWRLRDYLRRRQLRAATRSVPSTPTSRGA